MAVKKWRGKWVVDLKIDGKRVRRVSPDQTKAGAKRYEAELLLGLSTPTSCSGPGDGTAQGGIECPTLAEFAPEWLVTYAVPNNKPSERIRKERLLRLHVVPFFGKWRLDEITLHRVEAFKAAQLGCGLKASTINNHLAILGTLLRHAVEWDRLGRALRIRPLPAEQPAFDWLKPPEAGQLLRAAKAMDTRWYTFFLAALRTGLRKGELLALHWREVDFERRRLTVKYTAFRGRLGSPKSSKARVVPMVEDLARALLSWRAASTGPLVFPDRAGGVMSGAQLPNLALHRALALAGLRPIRFHDLRHTFASHLVLKKRSLKEIQMLLGHHSVTVTERYAHIGQEQLVTAVSVLDGLGTDDADDGAEER